MKLPLERDELRGELVRTIDANRGDAAKQISNLTADYSTNRTKFLGEQAQKLETALGQNKSVARLAQNGKSGIPAW